MKSPRNWPSFLVHPLAASTMTSNSRMKTRPPQYQNKGLPSQTSSLSASSIYFGTCHIPYFIPWNQLGAQVLYQHRARYGLRWTVRSCLFWRGSGVCGDYHANVVPDSTHSLASYDTHVRQPDAILRRFWFHIDESAERRSGSCSSLTSRCCTLSSCRRKGCRLFDFHR